MADEHEERIDYSDEQDTQEDDPILEDLEDGVADDEIDPAEEGFVRGYEGDEEDSFDDDEEL